MLKIRDDVDLKELEKFGFEICKWDENQYIKEICSGRRGQAFYLIVFKKRYYGEDRYIYGYAEGADGDGEEAYIDDTLYDLIKANMVEKSRGVRGDMKELLLDINNKLEKLYELDNDYEINNFKNKIDKKLKVIEYKEKYDINLRAKDFRNFKIKC